MQKIDDSFDGTFNQNIRSNTYKTQNANKKNKLIINVNETQYAVVKHVAKKNKWNLIAQPVQNLNFDICWVDGIAKQDLFARMNQYQKINHFPGMGILSRKNNLGNNLMKFRKKFGSEYEFFPITWHLPYDFNELQAYHQCRQQGKAQTFIVKPQASCQGRGIYLTRNIDKIKYDKCVVQRYLHKPYLIDGLKFDLRIYVLVAGIDPLRIFVYEEGLARFATQQYKPPRSQNLQNMYMHLTNYAINKDSQKFIFNESATDMSVGHKRSLTSVYKKIAEEGHDVEALKEKINDIFRKTIITGYPTLSHTYSSIHPDNFGNDMCFQILGFDVMLDHKLNPYLIQINYTPSFTADTPLDRFIKKKLITDTLNLVGVNQKWKKQSKMKKDKEVQQRMITGKRKKYTPQQRKILMRQQAKKRDQFERKNLGGYVKIFMNSEEQMQQYKKYYDYAMDIYVAQGKTEFNNYQKPTSHPTIFYNSYFDEIPTIQSVKQKKQTRESLKNHEIHKQKKLNESSTNFQRVQQSTTHYNNSNSKNGNKRVSSAKSRNDKKQRRVVYDNGQSKKSLKIDSTKQKLSDNYENGMQNSSIFQNKMIENLLLKQQKKAQSMEDFQFDD